MTDTGSKPRQKPIRRVKAVAKTGLRDLPSNAAWALSKAFKTAPTAAHGVSNAASSAAQGVSQVASSVADTAGSAKSGAQKRASHAKDRLAAAVPFVGNDSVESLLQQADQAAERARLAEQQAVVLAQSAKDAADEAARVAREAAARKSRW